MPQSESPQVRVFAGYCTIVSVGIVMTMPLRVTVPPPVAPPPGRQAGPVTFCTMPVIEKPFEPLPERAAPAAGKLGSTGPAGGMMQGLVVGAPVGQPEVGAGGGLAV